MPPDAARRNKQWRCEASGKYGCRLGAEGQRGARTSAWSHCGPEDHNDSVRRVDQQVTGLPVATDVTNASKAPMVSTISPVVIG